MRVLASLLVLAVLLVAAARRGGGRPGAADVGRHVTLAPAWFDPAQTPRASSRRS